MDSIFIARQPIYDERLEVVAYELLYRHAQVTQARIIDGDQATSDVLINSCLEFGMEALVGRVPAFVNLTRNFIVGEQQLPLPPNQVVLEVLEDIEFDAEVLQGLQALAARGYTIALDDFRFQAHAEQALQLASIVKLDVLGLDDAELQRQIGALADYEVLLLAEKVETQAVFDRCRELGCRYFQGYFFSKPNLVAGRRQVSNRAAIMGLLAMLQDPDATPSEIEGLIAQDPPLALRLLRYLNSPTVGAGGKVSSLRTAMMLLGAKTIRNWASLIALTCVDDKPQELGRMALVRARTCELAAQKLGRPRPDGYFTAGLFSLIDAIMDQPMAELLERLALAPEIEAALLERTGPMGTLLHQVIANETGQWHAIDLESTLTVQQCYLQALQWADETLGQLGVQQPPRRRLPLRQQALA